MPHLVVAQSVSVSSLQRKVLEKIIRRSKSAQQHVIRAKIILFAAEGFDNRAIADELTIHRETVRIWRRRWRAASEELLTVEEQDTVKRLHEKILEVLSDEQRSGVTPKFSAEAVCQIIAVSCEDPQECGHPLSHWTAAALRMEVLKRKIVEDISERQIGRFLKRRRYQAASGALLGNPAG